MTLDVAVDNLAKVIAYIASIKMPNGEDPRGLRVKGLLVPPALTARASQLTQAEYIAQAAASGGGSGDIRAIISRWGFGVPQQADELASVFTGGSDTTYYVIAEQITSSELGAMVYVNREPFQMIFHGPMTDAQLARLVWDLTVHVVDNGEKLADNICLRAADGTPLLAAAVGVGPAAHLLLAALLATEQATTLTPESIQARLQILEQWPTIKPQLEAQILSVRDAVEVNEDEGEGDGEGSNEA